MWYEVESKIKINDYKKVKSSVLKVASFKDKELKFDRYFAIKDDWHHKKSFRIRGDGQKFIVNFKKRVKIFSDKEVVVKQEFEFPIDNKDDLDIFIALHKDLGFNEWIHKKKQTELFLYNKNKKLHIELNKVSNLGYWMEIEYLCNNRNEIFKAKKLIKEVTSIISDGLGSIDNTGYTKMLYKMRSK